MLLLSFVNQVATPTIVVKGMKPTQNSSRILIPTTGNNSKTSPTVPKSCSSVFRKNCCLFCQTHIVVQSIVMFPVSTEKGNEMDQPAYVTKVKLPSYTVVSAGKTTVKSLNGRVVQAKKADSVTNSPTSLSKKQLNGLGRVVTSPMTRGMPMRPQTRQPIRTSLISSQPVSVTHTKHGII